MRHGDKQLGAPLVQYTDTKANIEALTGLIGGETAFATDNPTAPLGCYNGTVWVWGGSGDNHASSLTVVEQDGSPSISSVDTLIFSGASITDSGSGDALISITSESVGSPYSNTLFLNSVDSDVSTYDSLTNIVPTTGVSATNTLITGDTIVKAFVSEPNKFNFLEKQNCYVYISFYKVGGTKDLQGFVQLYHRTAGGTETLLGTSNYSSVLTTSVLTESVVTLGIPRTIFTATDRLVLKVLGHQSGAGTDPTLTFNYGQEAFNSLARISFGANTIANTTSGGWTQDPNTWTYSSIDSPTGIISVNADMTDILYEKTRISFTQLQALTAYFPMDSDSTSTVGSFTSTDTSMTYTAGKFSNAGTFNGTTSKVVITDTALMKPTGEWTIGAWFKTSNTGAPKCIFQSYSANTAIAGVDVRVTAANVLSATVGKNTGTTLGVDYSAVAGTTTVTDGNWHYVVYTFRNNYLQIYLDGNLEASGYCFTPAYAATNYVRIGCHRDSASDNTFFNGQIDDLYIINGYALDEKTVYDKYIATAAQGTGDITVEKMGIVTSVGTYSSGATLVTAYFGTDYMLANATISDPKYSRVTAPARFPTAELKWFVLTSVPVDTTKTTATASTWYGGALLTPTGPSITIPIGTWYVDYKAVGGVNFSTATVAAFGMRVTLSTANNSQSDGDFTTIFTFTPPIAAAAALRFTAQTKKTLKLRTKTTYYLNAFQGSVTAGDVVGFLGATFPTIIRATSALL